MTDHEYILHITCTLILREVNHIAILLKILQRFPNCCKEEKENRFCERNTVPVSTITLLLIFFPSSLSLKASSPGI